ncbi:MAG: hydroxymethylbilane synthase [Acidobacteriota bacterium]
MGRALRIGTRGSALALWQANEVARLLGGETEIVTIKTTGDKRPNVSLAAIGGKGLWVKELEEALLRGEIDLAVHSLKDVPSIMPDEFVLAAFLERADPCDVWVQADGKAIGDLPAGATIATSAPRRRAQLRARWPHLQVEEIRGNVDTRLRKLRDGLYDGGVLAAAGLVRLGLAGQITSTFSMDEMLPAAGQGIIAVETLRDARIAVDHINHEPTAIAARCERGVLQKFGTVLDCYSPIAVHATLLAVIPSVSEGPVWAGGAQPVVERAAHPHRSLATLGMTQITIRAFYEHPDGRVVRVEKSGAREDVIDAVYGELTA